MHYDETQVELYRSRTPRSRALWERMRQVVPSGHAGGMGAFFPHPIVVERGQGCWLWDVDGNRYLDLRLGDWVLIHGHSDPDVQAAVADQMGRMVQVGAHEWDLGHRLASLLVERTPSIEMVRLFVSGTDANLCAVRLARAYTGRHTIAKAIGSYHGTADTFAAGTSVLRSADERLPLGVHPHALDEIVEFPYNDPDGAERVLREHAHLIAAVLVEPVMTAAGMVEGTREFHHRLREVTRELGILLILDEVVTYPVAYGGAQVALGIEPDLTTLGKAIGGGLPVSAVGGRREIMQMLEADPTGTRGSVSVMSTFGGNSACLAAGITGLQKLTPQAHARLTTLGDRVRSHIDDLGVRHGIPLHATGAGHLIGIHWADERVVDLATRLHDDRDKVQNINLALDNLGYYQTFTGLFLLSTAIGEQEVEDFLAAFEQALEILGYVPDSASVGA